MHNKRINPDPKSFRFLFRISVMLDFTTGGVRSVRLSEPFEKSGYFWLPGKTENRLPGVLRIAETGQATLEVIGIFGDTVAALNETSPALGRIVGVIESGDLVTLERCFYKKGNISLGGISKSTIYANFVLSGVQYDEGEPITFSKFNFSVEGLDEWLMVSGLRVEHNWDDRSVSIHFTPPKEIELQLPDGIGLAFTFDWTLPGAPIVTEAKITQKAYISLTSESLRSIDDFLAVVFKINNFLCLATDEIVSLDSATAYSHKITRSMHEVPIKVYYQSIPLSEMKPKVQWHGMLFRHRDIATQLEPILNNWLNNYETSEPAFNLYFASKSGAHRYLEGRFLSLAQGIETLHRRNSQKTLMVESEFNDLVAAVIKSCPRDKQECLKTKIEYANELPLRQRLRQMLEPFMELYGDSKQRKHFIGKVIDTRNYLTHYDARLSQQAAGGEELWKLCMKLEGLFQLHFLRLIGLNGESINTLVKENHALRSKLEI